MIVNTITEAKTHFSALIEKVLEGEEVIIKKAGKPVAVLGKYPGKKVEARLNGAIRSGKEQEGFMNGKRTNTDESFLLRSASMGDASIPMTCEVWTIDILERTVFRSNFCSPKLLFANFFLRVATAFSSTFKKDSFINCGTSRGTRGI